MTPTQLLDDVEKLFADHGAAAYHGEAVSQLEHALQAAHLAEVDGRPATVIAAALLHDVGHLLHALGDDCATQGVDDQHQELGVRLLAKGFGPEVTEPVRLHVAAKRYLCKVKTMYILELSVASARSLELQGGPLSAKEAREFEEGPHFEAAVAVREYDDRAKVAGLATPPVAHFRPYLEATLRADFG